MRARHGAAAAAATALLLMGAAPAGADVKVGDKAPLFKSIDEDGQPVDMRDMIEGRPLVLATGSAS